MVNGEGRELEKVLRSRVFCSSNAQPCVGKVGKGRPGSTVAKTDSNGSNGSKILSAMVAKERPAQEVSAKSGASTTFDLGKLENFILLFFFQ